MWATPDEPLKGGRSGGEHLRKDKYKKNEGGRRSTLEKRRGDTASDTRRAQERGAPSQRATTGTASTHQTRNAIRGEALAEPRQDKQPPRARLAPLRAKRATDV